MSIPGSKNVGPGRRRPGSRTPRAPILGVLLGLLALAAPCSRASAGFTVIDGVHADLAMPYVAPAPGGAARWDIHLHTGGDTDFTNYRPDEALLLANDSTLLTMPDLPELNAVVGAAPGEQIYLLDWDFVPGQLYLGVEADYNFDRTLRMQLSDFLAWDPDGAGFREPFQYVDIALKAVRGPAGGVFSTFFFGSVGELFVNATSADGIDASDRWAQIIPSHSHQFWTFSEPGRYEIDLQARTFLADGTEVISPVTTFHFAAGNAAAVPEPASLALLGAGGLASALAAIRRRRSIPEPAR